MSATTFPQQLARRDQPRLRRYKANLDFYSGKQWPARRSNDKSRRLTLNYARTIIEKTAAYVMAGRTIQITPPTEAGANTALEAEQLLAAIAGANALDRIDFDTEVDTSVLGDGAFKVTWSDLESRVVVTAPDVQGIFVWPKPHNLTAYDQVAHRYTLDRDQAVAAFGIPVSKDTVTVVERWTDAIAEAWIDNTLVLSGPNPYGAIPFAVFPNSPVPKDFWGLSDIESIREPATELNREMSVLSAIMEVSGNPIAVLAGVDSAEDIAAQAGATWVIPENAKAYLLDLLSGGGVSLHIDYLNSIYRTLHDLAESPRTTFGDTGRALSGVALQIEIQPILQKVARKRLIRSEAYRRRAQLCLQITDQITGSQHAAAGTIAINWGEVTPEDRTENANREIALFQAALSSAATALSRLGESDPQKEWVRILAEKKELAAVQPTRTLNLRTTMP